MKCPVPYQGPKSHAVELIFFSLERNHLVKFVKNPADLGLWALRLSCTGEKATANQYHCFAAFS